MSTPRDFLPCGQDVVRSGYRQHQLWRRGQHGQLAELEHLLQESRHDHTTQLLVLYIYVGKPTTRQQVFCLVYFRAFLFERLVKGV